jgi:predicted GIY-YIG superfamily endonuclease
MTEEDYQAVQRVADMHAVYRMFSATGRLLYVGVSSNLTSRLASHADKRWFPLVATIRLQWFPTRDAAEVAEKEAIRIERPEINIVGTPKSVRKAPPLSVGLDEALKMGTVSLGEAVSLNILRCSLDAARKRAHRDPAHPRPVGKNGLALIYDVAELHTYQSGWRNKAGG